ncbi:MAG: hypothetical protein IPK65_02145 [Gammaproteobacteria bacterium]|nr:hypothetical protein [Gammaproteobacteria bacterium]
MTSITPPRDDAGRLRPADATRVDKTRRSAPKPAPRAVRGRADEVARDRDTPPLQRTRGPERRVQERRRRREGVLLDTRSAIGNRRRGARRGEDLSSPRRRADDTDDPPGGAVLGDDVRA